MMSDVTATLAAEKARSVMESWRSAGVATPSIVIDGAGVERNLQKMAEYCRRHRLGLRPHAKTHKSLRLAARQLSLGACGLTVAKVAEAEVMAEIGGPLLVAYPIVSPEPAARLARLASHTTVDVAIDSTVAAKCLADAAARESGASIGILIEIDVGFGRTGAQFPADALAIAQFVERRPELQLNGICCFPGQIIGPSESQTPALDEYANRLQDVIALWRRHGLEAKIVSGGSTPTAYQSHRVSPLTEIRPGTYIFNDMNTVRGGHCSLGECAARIAATVVSNAAPGQVVIDAGSKVLTSDRCGPAPDSGFGYVVEYPQAKIVRLSEEHGHVDIRDCATPPLLGERVTVIPNHICPCINLQDAVYFHEPNGSILRLPVEARGKVW